jgi:hypothetical protein
MSRNRNSKYQIHYNEFKKEATIVELKSETSKIKVIKWRGKVFQSKSYVEVFDKVKDAYLKE